MVTDAADALTKHLVERGPWCCGAGRAPHVVDAEDLDVVDGAVVCAACADRLDEQRR